MKKKRPVARKCWSERFTKHKVIKTAVRAFDSAVSECILRERAVTWATENGLTGPFAFDVTRHEYGTTLLATDVCGHVASMFFRLDGTPSLYERWLGSK